MATITVELEDEEAQGLREVKESAGTTWEYVLRRGAAAVEDERLVM